MAKKKSKRFIIPASHFIAATSTLEEKLDIPLEELQESISSTINEESSEYDEDKSVQNIQKSTILPKKEITKPPILNLSKSSRRNSALSLASLKRNKLEEEKLKNKQNVVGNSEDLPKDPFTEETFLKIWVKYIEDLHQKGEKIFASILKADLPTIKSNLICVTYPNEMMKAELLKVKSKALNHLRQKLNNYSIDFKITVNEENTKKFAYTPQEKYDLLKEKNKAISLLRKTFNLEL